MEEFKLKILLDAMGGDNAPDANIKGALNAINKIKAEVILIGKEDIIREKVKEFTGKEIEKVSEFMEKNRIQYRFFRKRWKLEYDEAVALVTSLGANTGRSKMLVKKNPVCGRLYWRYGA